MEQDLAQQVDDVTAVLEAERPATPRATAAFVVAYAHLLTAEILRMTLGWHTTQRDALATELVALADQAVTTREH